MNNNTLVCLKMSWFMKSSRSWTGTKVLIDFIPKVLNFFFESGRYIKNKNYPHLAKGLDTGNGEEIWLFLALKNVMFKVIIKYQEHDGISLHGSCYMVLIENVFRKNYHVFTIFLNKEEYI